MLLAVQSTALPRLTASQPPPREPGGVVGGRYPDCRGDTSLLEARRRELLEALLGFRLLRRQGGAHVALHAGGIASFTEPDDMQTHMRPEICLEVRSVGRLTARGAAEQQSASLMARPVFSRHLLTWREDEARAMRCESRKVAAPTID